MFGDRPGYPMGFSCGFFIPEKELVLANLFFFLSFFLGGGVYIFILSLIGIRSKADFFFFFCFFCLVDGRYDVPDIISPQVP